MTPQLTAAPDVTTPDTDRPTPSTPGECVLELLADSGGRLAERRLVMETRLSTAACRRVLDELSAAGELSCHETGRERIVCLPDSVPTTSR